MDDFDRVSKFKIDLDPFSFDIEPKDPLVPPVRYYEHKLRLVCSEEKITKK